MLQEAPFGLLTLPVAAEELEVLAGEVVEEGVIMEAGLVAVVTMAKMGKVLLAQMP